jgi:hypothetical protein
MVATKNEKSHKSFDFLSSFRSKELLLRCFLINLKMEKEKFRFYFLCRIIIVAAATITMMIMAAIAA